MAVFCHNLALLLEYGFMKNYLIYDENKIKVFSFDVFDTVLTRDVATPKDIFLFLQKKLLKTNINEIPNSLKNNFAEIRGKAEFVCRLRAYSNNKGEITLQNIYEEISKKFTLDFSQIQLMMDMELNLEYQSVYPVRWTLAQIERLRNQQKRIVFTSDMYLPLVLIKKMLDKVGAYRPEDGVYLSSDVGCKKLDGTLFQHILKEEKCSAPNQLCHFGDDLYSDVRIPFQMGISLYKQNDSQVYRALRYSYLIKLKQIIQKFL